MGDLENHATEVAFASDVIGALDTLIKRQRGAIRPERALRGAVTPRWCRRRLR